MMSRLARLAVDRTQPGFMLRGWFATWSSDSFPDCSPDWCSEYSAGFSGRRLWVLSMLSDRLASGCWSSASPIPSRNGFSPSSSCRSPWRVAERKVMLRSTASMDVIMTSVLFFSASSSSLCLWLSSSSTAIRPPATFVPLEDFSMGPIWIFISSLSSFRRLSSLARLSSTEASTLWTCCWSASSICSSLWSSATMVPLSASKEFMRSCRSSTLSRMTVSFRSLGSLAAARPEAVRSTNGIEEARSSSGLSKLTTFPVWLMHGELVARSSSTLASGIDEARDSSCLEGPSPDNVNNVAPTASSTPEQLLSRPSAPTAPPWAPEAGRYKCKCFASTLSSGRSKPSLTRCKRSSGRKSFSRRLLFAILPSPKNFSHVCTDSGSVEL
mmetsp:Transcript_107098/g.284979  ORF Transcript_107098/g.284979 Transcript_107098/m.284979 type:complete len:384 (+) Transcript_107098:150-1301(+)